MPLDYVLSVIRQPTFGFDVYPSVVEKAAAIGYYNGDVLSLSYNPSRRRMKVGGEPKQFAQLESGPAHMQNGSQALTNTDIDQVA